MGAAAGRKYHKRCIRCKTCDTSIGSLQITEREGEIYCKQCYAKDFGPKGYRPSLGTSINDY
ncbi:Cysteine-rich protein 2-binding protein [Coemansia sp. S142-1]|nr:Cysteine-rich protein 2-binding protein [Coemansia sp. S142-1]